MSINCPYTPETHHLVDEAALSSDEVRPRSWSTRARGPIVDEAALVGALEARQIAGAALDVFEAEPDVHPGLLGRDDVVLVPHLGSATIETRGAMASLAAENVASFLATGAPVTPVN